MLDTVDPVFDMLFARPAAPLPAHPLISECEPWQCRFIVERDEEIDQ